MKKIILNLKNIQFGTILNNINYEVRKDDFIILLGSNGSGKSSLLKVIDQRYQTTFGKIELENKEFKKYSSKKLAHKIVTLTQDSKDSLFCSLTVLENCILANERCENNFLKLALNKKKGFFIDYLAKFNPKLAIKLNLPVNKLSGGEQQTLALALSTLHPPKILLLDEHTSALDPKTAENLLNITNEIVRKHKITCILTTHNLETAIKFGNRIVAMKNGRIFKKIEPNEKKQLTAKHLFDACYE